MTAPVWSLGVLQSALSTCGFSSMTLILKPRIWLLITAADGKIAHLVKCYQCVVMLKRYQAQLWLGCRKTDAFSVSAAEGCNFSAFPTCLLSLMAFYFHTQKLSFSRPTTTACSQDAQSCRR